MNSGIHAAKIAIVILDTVRKRKTGMSAQRMFNECPNGFTCSAVATAGSDVVYMCVSSYVRLCDPCHEHKIAIQETRSAICASRLEAAEAFGESAMQSCTAKRRLS